jgi:hypothetical protein
MDVPDIVTLIGVFTLIRLLFDILADAPKVWENVCKAWELSSTGLSSLFKKTLSCSTFVAQKMSRLVARKAPRVVHQRVRYRQHGFE